MLLSLKTYIVYPFMIRLAIDAMGGDNSPSVVVNGAVAAARHLNVRLALVGQPKKIEDCLAIHPDWKTVGIEIVPAADVIDMADQPAAALRRKPLASIRVAIDLVAKGKADAVFSAGNTGATVIAAHAAFGMIPGVGRPALATTIPTTEQPAVLLDAGASTECRAEHLLQFGLMGSVYARLALGVKNPRIGLLSIGEEETKGNELTRDAYHQLKTSPVEFIGSVEARDVYRGVADVIVCDGFTGNVVLKVSEGLVEAVELLLEDELKGTFSSQVGYLLSQRAFRRFRKRVDYSEYGGAPLMGVAGLAVVGHGRSSVKAIRNAIVMAYRFVSTDFVKRVEEEVSITVQSK